MKTLMGASPPPLWPPPVAITAREVGEHPNLHGMAYGSKKESQIFLLILKEDKIA
jgi:hypothetical protein